MNKKYDDGSQLNDDWPLWRKLVLSELEALQIRVRDLETKEHTSRVEMALLKSRITIMVLILTALGNAAFAWLIKRFSE